MRSQAQGKRDFGPFVKINQFYLNGGEIYYENMSLLRQQY
jgi:hypothetical protein